MNHDSEPISEQSADDSRPAGGACFDPAGPAEEIPPDLWDVLLARWNALGEEVFSGRLVDARRLSDLGRDCELLATVMTWFRAEGNITRAAERLNSSRRALRLRIYSWRDTYPEYVPPGASKTSARKTRGADDEATNDEPTRDAPPASPSHPSSPEEAAP